MDHDRILAAPASVFGAELSPGPVVTVSRTEVWSSLAVLAGAALAVLAGSGLAIWFAAASV
jgi:hypothetical protein